MIVQVGNSVRRVITFALVAMMMTGSLMAPAPTMAQSQSLQSSLTGVTIAYGAPYSLYDDGQFADDTMETMMFVGPADILAMGFMSPLIDLNGARDIMLEALFGEIGSASTIDRGDYSGVSYSLDMLNIDGQEMGVFSLFMNQRSHGYSEFYIFLAPPTLFGASMQTAQNSFTIDGNQLMDGVDASVMGNMVTANVGITGGEAVTDVTDVADPAETNTTETTTTPSGDTPTEEGAEITYLLQVMVEYAAVDNSIVSMLEALQQMDSGEIDAQQARTIMDESSAYLSGVTDRVGLIPVPPGLQDFHQQETLVWAESVTAIGTTWIDLVAGSGTDAAAAQALQNGVNIHISFGDTLQAQQVSVNTTPETTDPTEVAQTDTGEVDASSYVESIQAHRAEFFTSLGRFNDSMGGMEGEPTDAQIQAALEGTLTEAELWTGFEANAQQLTPPAGYENVHAVYLEWAGHITEFGNIWIAAMNGDSSQVDVFFGYLPTIQQADDDLQAAITAASSQDTGSQSADAEGDSADSTETTSRTTRTTGSSDDEDSGETSETTSRTSRSTDAGDEVDTDAVGTSENTSRTSRTSDPADEDDETGTTSERPNRTERTRDTSDPDEDAGNTSETSSRTTRGGTETVSDSLPNEWLAEANEVSITWSDDFALSDHTDVPQASNASTGEDTLYLMTTTPDGETVRFSVIVLENPGSDSTPLIDSFVNDPSGAEDVWGAGTEVHDYNMTAGASAVLMRAEDDIGGYWIYVQVTCLDSTCGTVVLLEIGTEGSSLVDTLDTAQSGLAVDGVTVSTALPSSDIEGVVEQVGD